MPCVLQTVPQQDHESKKAWSALGASRGNVKCGDQHLERLTGSNNIAICGLAGQIHPADEYGKIRRAEQAICRRTLSLVA
jgi:hypothetical protein